MKRDYFISFDYFTENKNKFCSGIVDVDMSEVTLNQICIDLINSQDNEEDKNSWTVKVNSFNNID